MPRASRSLGTVCLEATDAVPLEPPTQWSFWIQGLPHHTEGLHCTFPETQQTFCDISNGWKTRLHGQAQKRNSGHAIIRMEHPYLVREVLRCRRIRQNSACRSYQPLRRLSHPTGGRTTEYPLWRWIHPQEAGWWGTCCRYEHVHRWQGYASPACQMREALSLFSCQAGLVVVEIKVQLHTVKQTWFNKF